MKALWDDIENFVMPELTGNAQASATTIEEYLIQIYNHLLYISQYEPEWKKKIEEIELEIKTLEEQKQILLKDGQLRIDEIDDKYKKNKEMLEAYITRDLFKEEFEELNNQINELRRLLLKRRAEYERLSRKIKLARINIDTGRSILSALKQELQNENFSG